MKSAVAVRTARETGLLFATLLGAFALAGLASPRAFSEEVTLVRVSISDLDPSSPGDVKKIYERLDKAAHRVCGYPNGVIGKDAAFVRSCYEDALTDAVSRVKSPALVTLHRERAGSAS